MTTSITDVLMPLEDEVLFSWAIRMVKNYSDNRYDVSYKEAMNILFGKKSGVLPGIYFQKGLSYFVQNCGLKGSHIFKSEDSMIDNLTILPFYQCFLDENRIVNLKKDMQMSKTYNPIYDAAKIVTQNKHLEGCEKIKLCPECQKGHDVVFLKREHQVPGNYICWKHGCELASLTYEANWNSVIDIERRTKNGDYVFYGLSDEETRISKRIAKLIHVIFKEGLKEDCLTIKKKIWKKLSERDEISLKGEFADLSGFCRELNIDYLYKYVSLEDEVKASLVEFGIYPNPIIYLIMIDKLFGGLDELYAYHLESENTIKLLSPRLKEYDINKKPMDIKQFCEIMGDDFFAEHSIIGDTEQQIIIKHEPCGHYYRDSKKRPKLKKCAFCTHNKKTYKSPPERKVGHTRFLTEAEYGRMHNKSRAQVRLYVSQGRIDGVIRCGNISLIPKDSPYPDDKRKGEREVKSFSFLSCNIPIGAELFFCPNGYTTTNIKCIVSDDSHVKYNGEIYSLSRLAKILLGVNYDVYGLKYFKYNGKWLRDIKKDMSALKEK